MTQQEREAVTAAVEDAVLLSLPGRMAITEKISIVNRVRRVLARELAERAA